MWVTITLNNNGISFYENYGYTRVSGYYNIKKIDRQSITLLDGCHTLAHESYSVVGDNGVLAVIHKMGSVDHVLLGYLDNDVKRSLVGTWVVDTAMYAVDATGLVNSLRKDVPVLQIDTTRSR